MLAFDSMPSKKTYVMLDVKNTIVRLNMDGKPTHYATCFG